MTFCNADLADLRGKISQLMLSAGTRLDRYEILTLIGVGGMGEVYKSRDTLLDRIVALKLSCAQFSERFSREARTVAALNHPHICTLYDVGPNYLVMEFVEGESLAARLKKGKLSVEDTFRYGAQIADALAEAHSKGIIHRDLKPANIMLPKSGVKLLDFGLAKSHGDETLTLENAVLGTPAYMAPEQREGTECDPRSDIYSFGLVLQEMATGKRSHTEGLPAQLARVIERCLQQDPENRWQSAKDVKFELEWAPAAVAPAHRTHSRRTWAAAAGLMALGVCGGWFASHLRSSGPPPHVLRLSVNPPPGGDFLAETGGAILGGKAGAISPDGRLMVFVVTMGGVDKLWLRALDSLSGTELPGTETARYAFWSPDSRAIGFFAKGKLQRIDVAGGLPVVLCDSPSARGGSWATDVILFSPNAGPLQRVAATGGKPVAATTLDRAKSENSHRWPHFLPDGRRFLYSIRGGPASDSVYIGSLDRPEEKILLVAHAHSASFVPGRDGRRGSLLWVSGSRLLAQPFDTKHLKLSGEPRVVVDDILTDINAHYSVSNDGTLLYTRTLEHRSQPTWYSRERKVLGAAGPADTYEDAAIAPDGKRIAVVRREVSGSSDIWLIDSSRGTPVRLTFHGGHYPVWSPDGRRIAFIKGGPSTLTAIATNGSGKEESLIDNLQGLITPHSWSPDGRFLLYTFYSYQYDLKTLNDVWLLPLNGDRKPVPLLQTEFQEIRGQFSPDGKWISYTSDQSGRSEVYVQRFPPDGIKHQISSGGGDFSHWRMDGRELFFRSAEGTLMTVSVKAGEFGAPASLCHIGSRLFDVAPDGQRFLELTPLERTEASPMVLLVNWEEVLDGNRK